MCEIQKEKIVLALHGQKDSTYTKDLKERLRKYDEKISNYDKEKNEITKLAKGLESQQAETKMHSDTFGMGVIFLQISILLSSIAAIVKKRPIWLLSIGIGLVGIVYFLNGFFLFL